MNSNIDIYKSFKTSHILVKISYILLVIGYCLFIISLLKYYNSISSFMIVWLSTAFYFFTWPFIKESQINKKLLNIFLVLFLVLLLLFFILNPTMYFIQTYLIFTVLIIIMAWAAKFKLYQFRAEVKEDYY